MPDAQVGDGQENPSGSVRVGAKPVSPTKALKKSMPPEAAARAAADLIRRANAEADQKAAQQAHAVQERHLAEAVAGAARVRRVWAARSAGERALTLIDIADRVHTAGRSVGEYDHDRMETVAERWRWYAKWAAKLARLSERDGYPAPYGGPHPTGVVAVVAGPQPSLLELSSLLAPVLAGGNAVVLLADRGGPAVRALFDALAVASLPAGLVRVVAPAPGVLDLLLTQPGIDGLDLQGCDETSARRCAERADPDRRLVQPEPDVDWTDKPGKARLRAWCRSAGSPAVVRSAG